MFLLLPFAYLVAAVAGHALLMRLPARGNSVARFVGVGGVIGLGLIVQTAVLYGWAVETFAVLAVYAFACELYIFLFTLVGTSIGVKLLLALRDGPLAPGQIEQLASTAGMVQRRLERMRATGLLEPDGTVSPRGRRLVRTFRALRGFFLPEHLHQPARPGRSPALDTAPKPLL